MTRNRRQKPLKTLVRAFELIEHLEEMDGPRLREIAARTPMAKSTVYRHLTTLESLGYVTLEGERYYNSFRFVEIGEGVRERKQAYRLARETVEELAEETGERVQFFVEEHGYAIYVCMQTGERGVQTDAGLGRRLHLHATAGGKAILANLPPERVEEILDERGLPALTDETITDRERLFEVLDEVRDQGYSLNKQEYSKGSRAVGVPVLDDDDGVVGALSVTGPTLRMRGEFYERELPNLLMGKANELELKILYS